MRIKQILRSTRVNQCTSDLELKQALVTSVVWSSMDGMAFRQ